MAQLIKAIETNDVFANGRKVNSIVEQRNKLVDGLFTKLRTVID